MHGFGIVCEPESYLLILSSTSRVFIRVLWFSFLHENIIARLLNSTIMEREPQVCSHWLLLTLVKTRTVCGLFLVCCSVVCLFICSVVVVFSFFFHTYSCISSLYDRSNLTHARRMVDVQPRCLLRPATSATVYLPPTLRSF